MKIRRLSTLLVAALALPTAAFAADVATLFSLKGSAKMTKGETESMAAVGNDIPNGTLFQTGSGASAGVKLPDGTTVYLGANTSVRVRFSNGGKSVEITLLKGVVAGDFTASNVTVRTSAGVVKAGGSLCSVSVEAGVSGVLATVEVAKGGAQVELKGADKPTAVPAGTSMSFGDNTAPAAGALTQERLAQVTAAAGGSFSTEKPAGAKPVTNPAASGGTGTNAQKIVPDLSVLSPNGEGATN